MKMEQIVCSETSAYKIQPPGNYPEENIQQSMSDYTMRRNCKLIGKLPSGDMNAGIVVEH
jgi:hypothetical protein